MLSHPHVQYLYCSTGVCAKSLCDIYGKLGPQNIFNLQKLSRWLVLSRKLRVGDIVCLRKEPMSRTKWPLARIIEVHPGKDGKVRVITVKRMKGIYKRPIVKVVPLMRQSWLKLFSLAGGMLAWEKKWRERDQSLNTVVRDSLGAGVPW